MSSDGFTVDDLDFDAHYEVLVCYRNAVQRWVRNNSVFEFGLIEQCGYCRTCFSTGAILNVTSATVSAVATLSSEVLGEIYVCRAIGAPSPLVINWTAAETRGTGLANARLTEAIEGVEISNYIENGETVSELKINKDKNLSSVYCRANAGSKNITVTQFHHLDPIIAFINVTMATVMAMVVSSDVVVSEAYTCQAIGFPTPLSITWEAEDASQGVILQVSDEMFGVEIITSVEDDEIISELRLLSSARFHSPICVLANGFLPEVRHQQFKLLDHTTEIVTTGDVFTTENQVAKTIPVYTIIILAGVSVVLFGFIAVSILLIICIILKRKRKKLNILDASFEKNGYSNRHDVTLLNGSLPEDMFISPADLNVSVVIGLGEFGVIYKAYMKSTNNVVAVKTLKGVFATSSDIEKATKEIFKMSRFNHLNVMTLIGVCMAPANGGEVSVGPSIVMPFMAKGSLLDYLRKEAGNVNLIADTENEISIVRKNLVQICRQVTKGMEYLAEMKFVHRDLAARNCLIDSNDVIKVSDFGLTENTYNRNYFRQGKDGGEKLPLKWMALESIKFGIFSEKSDVWSYGVTCWEVFSGGAIPYPGLHPRAILDSLEEGVRLKRPKNLACCSDMYVLLESCWEVEQDKRPTFTKIHHTLNQFLASTADYVELTGLAMQ